MQIKSDACPSGKQISFFINDIEKEGIIDIVNGNVSGNKPGDYICDTTTTNTIQCDNFQECKNNTQFIYHSNTNISICCTVDSGCYNIPNMLLNWYPNKQHSL